MFFLEKEVIRNESRKILIADDKSFHLISLEDRLKKDYEVLTAQTVKEMIEVLDTNEIGLLLVDITIPDIDHGDVIELLHSDVHAANIPIIFLTSTMDRKSINRGKTIGAADFLLKPFSDRDLTECIEYYLTYEKPDSHKPIVLAVDDEVDVLKSVNWLLGRDYNVFTLPSPDKIKNILRKITPDLLIVDCMMSNFDGFETIRTIRQNPEHRDTPIVCLTSVSTAEDISKAILAGANDFVTKPIDGTLLKGKIVTHLKHYLIVRRMRKSTEKD
jgi:response regulator RpfG family c-di-GMP phosphodiesterase